MNEYDATNKKYFDSKLTTTGSSLNFDNLTLRYLKYKYLKNTFKSTFWVSAYFNQGRAPVAQWVVCPTHTRLIPGSKHDWCKSPLVFAMIAS